MMTEFPSETIEAITKFLFIGKQAAELGRYHLIIVLGNDDIIGTVQALHSLYTTGHLAAPDGHIILSGNVGSLNKGTLPEAERLLEEALNQGMPEDLFWLDKCATNALENYRYSKTIVDANGGFLKFPSILCIGKAFMMRRAKMCAAACGYPISTMDFYGTVDRTGRNIGPDCWWQTETAQIRVLEEIGRVSAYALKGDLSLS